jgi:hypothetical protein
MAHTDIIEGPVRAEPCFRLDVLGMVLGQNARARPVPAVAIRDEEAVSSAIVLLPTGELHY